MVVSHCFVTRFTPRRSDNSTFHRLIAVCHHGLALLLVIASINAGAVSSHAAPTHSAGYPKLIDWMTAGTSEDPLMAVGDFDAAFSNETHQSNLEYIQNDPDLIRSIKSELDSAELSWELLETRRRLLAVPEKRAPYAALFEAYCREVIDYVVASTGLRSPYGTIFTLDDDYIPDLSAAGGITVLLVHNLAEESIYTYAFQGGGDGSIAVELNQTLFIGELGSYTSHLVVREDGRFDFEPGRVTIWQNTAANPYSVLMVPVEETLHILLRNATEQAVKADLGNLQKVDVDPDNVVEEWVAIEEAIAGGLVNLLLPDFLERRVDGFQFDWIEDDLTLKQRLDRYRYLRNGIQVVKQLGVPHALSLYQGDPNKFRAMILALQTGGDAYALPEADTPLKESGVD